MDWKALSQYRRQIGLGLGLVLVVGWFLNGYRPRSDEVTRLSQQEEALTRERDQIQQAIAEEQRKAKDQRIIPARVAPAAAASLSPVDRLNYFLDNITKPANDLDLNYFTVTPMPPVAGPSFQEIPFRLSVAGAYAALADFLYQLEYGRDFIVRDLSMLQKGTSTQADFQLSALLLTDPATKPPAKTAKDPGRPTSLELARDPFVKPPAKVSTGPDGKSYFLNVPPGLSLSGMMNTQGRKVAIINHHPYGVGETIDNKIITKIDDRGVELSDKVRTYFLEMEQPRYSTVGRGKEALGR